MCAHVCACVYVCAPVCQLLRLRVLAALDTCVSAWASAWASSRCRVTPCVPKITLILQAPGAPSGAPLCYEGGPPQTPFLLPPVLSSWRRLYLGRHWGPSRRWGVRPAPLNASSGRVCGEPLGEWRLPAPTPSWESQEGEGQPGSAWAWRQEGVYTRVQACLRVSLRSKNSPEVTRQWWRRRRAAGWRGTPSWSQGGHSWRLPPPQTCPGWSNPLSGSTCRSPSPGPVL